MFKRLAKFNRRRAKDEARGIDISHDTPPESLLDETDSSSSESESEGENDIEASRHISYLRKRRIHNAPSVGDGDDQDSQDSGERDEGDRDEDEDEDMKLLVPPLSISQSLQSPFYASPDSPLKFGEPWISCVVCPLSQLKSEAQVAVHHTAKSHQRRLKRYKTYVAERLTETERVNDFEKGGADPRSIVREIEAESKRKTRQVPSKEAAGIVTTETSKRGQGSDSQVDGSVVSAKSKGETEDRAKARRVRKKVNKKAWKEAKVAKRKLKKERIARQETPGKAPVAKDKATVDFADN